MPRRRRGSCRRTWTGPAGRKVGGQSHRFGPAVDVDRRDLAAVAEVAQDEQVAVLVHADELAGGRVERDLVLEEPEALLGVAAVVEAVGAEVEHLTVGRRSAAGHNALSGIEYRAAKASCRLSLSGRPPKLVLPGPGSGCSRSLDPPPVKMVAFCDPSLANATAVLLASRLPAVAHWSGMELVMSLVIVTALQTSSQSSVICVTASPSSSMRPRSCTAMADRAWPCLDARAVAALVPWSCGECSYVYCHALTRASPETRSVSTMCFSVDVEFAETPTTGPEAHGRRCNRGSVGVPQPRRERFDRVACAGGRP